MRWQSVGGLAALTIVFLAAGYVLLWGARGFAGRRDAIRLGGFAYLLGVAAVTLVETELLVLGAPPSVPVVLGIVAAFGVVAMLARLVRRPPRPSVAFREREPFRLAGLGVAALVAAYLVDFLRAARLQSVYNFREWDAWSSWVTKAKSFYVFGGLDDRVYPTLFLPGYPILVPVLSATGFYFMGAPDTTFLHVQYLLLLVGFVLAVAGMLRPAVPLVVLWPFLLLVVLAPAVAYHAVSPQADLTMDYFFAGGGLCLVVWLSRREPWLLVCGAVLLAAAMSTKRESYLFAGALLVGLLVVTARQARRAWPRLALVVGLAALASVPWVLWRSHHQLGGQLQGTSTAELGSRLAPAARSVAEIIFGTGFWSLAVPAALAAALLALVAGRGSHAAVVYLVTLVISYGGMVAILAIGIDYTLGAHSDQNPIPRAAGALALLSVALGPALLAELFGGRDDRGSRPGQVGSG